MLNKVMLIGRLGADPRLSYSQQGTPIVRFNLATDNSYTDRDGQRIERTEWHRIVVFQRMAETCSNYLHKGSLAYVEGSLRTNKWQDQQGNDRFTTEIVAQRIIYLDRKNTDGGFSYTYQSKENQQATPKSKDKRPQPSEADLDKSPLDGDQDEVPFQPDQDKVSFYPQ